MKAFSYNVRVTDKQDKFGRGNTGIVFARTIESAEKKVTKRYCRRKTQKIIGIELEEVTSGMFETWNHSFNKKD